MQSSVREMVIELRGENPWMTLAEIGDRCGVTREAVRQHLHKAGLPTRALRNRRCYFCNRFLKKSDEYRLRRPTREIPNRYYCCLDCLEQIRPGRIIMLECEECHTLFPRREKVVIYGIGKRGFQHVWCSRKCHGKWLGKNFGVKKGDKPRRASWKTKWDHEKVWQEHLQTGWGVARLSKLLGIPCGTVTAILRKKRGFAKPARKYDWQQVWQKHLETGWGAGRLSRSLHIPMSTVSRILRKMRIEHFRFLGATPRSR